MHSFWKNIQRNKFDIFQTNAFQADLQFLYPWKRQKISVFLVIFKGYNNEILAWNVLRATFKKSKSSSILAQCYISMPPENVRKNQRFSEDFIGLRNGLKYINIWHTNILALTLILRNFPLFKRSLSESFLNIPRNIYISKANNIDSWERS